MRLLRVIVLFALALMVESCSRIEDGVIVSKSVGVSNPGIAGLEPTYIIVVEGRDQHGRIALRSALLSKPDWLDLKIGDRFSFAGRSLFEGPDGGHLAPGPKEQPRSRIKLPAYASTPTPSATAKKPSFFERAFNKPAGAATPAATPAAVAPTTKKKKPRKPSRSAKASRSPAKPAEANLDERYRKVRARAIEDSEVRDAKQKIHTATNEEDQLKASEEYQRMLFKKMRELDSSLAPRIDKEESESLGPPPQSTTR